MIILRECAHCGGEAENIRLGSTRQSRIDQCTNCGCSIESNDNFNTAFAWNTRIHETDTEKDPTMKTLHNTNTSGAKVNVPDIVVTNGDAFKIISKASSDAEGWMKSTKAMEIPYVGCVVQVTTQQRNPDGSYVIAEAVTFVPKSRLEKSNDHWIVSTV